MDKTRSLSRFPSEKISNSGETKSNSNLFFSFPEKDSGQEKNVVWLCRHCFSVVHGWKLFLDEEIWINIFFVHLDDVDDLQTQFWFKKFSIYVIFTEKKEEYSLVFFLNQSSEEITLIHFPHSRPVSCTPEECNFLFLHSEWKEKNYSFGM